MLSQDSLTVRQHQSLLIEVDFPQARTTRRAACLWRAGWAASLLAAFAIGNLNRAQAQQPTPGKSAIPPTATPPAQSAQPAKTAPNASALPVEDKPKLPPGYQPPRPVPPQIKDDKEDTFDPFKGDSKAVRGKKMIQYNALKFKGIIQTEEERALIRDIIHWKLAEMTLKDNREKVYDLRQKLVNDIRGTKGGKKEEPRDVRVLMLQSVVQGAQKLLDYNLATATNAAILLTEINDYEEVAGAAAVKAVPYVGATDTLIKLLNDEKQLDAVRIWAPIGLARILGVEDLKSLTRQQIVDALISQLGKSEKSHWWLQMRIAEALGVSNYPKDANNRPVVAIALAKVLVNEQRPWMVRAEAAQAIGRIPLDKNINLSLLVTEIVRLGQQMAAAYQKQPQNQQWIAISFKLYAAFKPQNTEEKIKGYGLLNKGNLGTNQKIVQEAYEKILSIVQNVIKGNPPAIPAVQADLDAWLKANEPKDLRVAPGEQPIVTKADGAKPAG